MHEMTFPTNLRSSILSNALPITGGAQDIRDVFSPKTTATNRSNVFGMQAIYNQTPLGLNHQKNGMRDFDAAT